MKVLMFGWEFPPHITGGLGTACYGLTKGLTAQGVEVLFVVPKTFGDELKSKAKLLSASSVSFEHRTTEQQQTFHNRLRYIQIGSSIIPYVAPETFARKTTETNVQLQAKSRVFSRNFQFSGVYGDDLLEEVARYALVASQLAATNEFDIIHAHDWLTYPAGMSAKETSGKPLVVHMHATEFDRSGNNVNGQVFAIEKAGMEKADRVITVSNLTRRTVIEKYGIQPEKVTTVHNAVEPDTSGEQAYKRALKEKIVTFLGRITFQKGPEYFVEAAHKVLQKDGNVRFVMGGSGDMLHRMVERVAQLGIGDRFHFTGFLKGEEVNRMFALSDVFVMPSVSEPFGIVPLEAMRSNVPVIISKQSGVSEVLHHAIKVDFWDIDGMADAIYGICHYPGLGKLFAKYGKEEVNNLKWEDAAHKVRKVYESLAGQFH